MMISKMSFEYKSLLMMRFCINIQASIKVFKRILNCGITVCSKLYKNVLLVCFTQELIFLIFFFMCHCSVNYDQVRSHDILKNSFSCHYTRKPKAKTKDSKA